jgi:hypothetical protein
VRLAASAFNHEGSGLPDARGLAASVLAVVEREAG